MAGDTTSSPISKTGCNFARGPKMCISVDYFDVTLKGSIISDTDSAPDTITISNDIHLMLDESMNSRFFKHTYDLYIHGEKYGTIRTVPRASILDPALSMLKVENHHLYRKNWIDNLNLVLKKMGLVVNNVSRLDIAIDGGEFIADYENLISGKWKKVGRATSLTFHDSSFKVKSFRVGKRGQDKSVLVYNKSLEMTEKKNKQYIKQMWEKNGLDTEKDIQRLELQMRRDVIKSIKDFDYNQLNNPKYLAGIVKSQCKGFYQFVENDGKKDVSRKEKIEAVNWAYFDNLEIEKLSKTNKPNVVYRVKNWVSHEMRRSYSGLEKGGKDLWDNAIIRCQEECHLFGIEDWFRDNVPKWENERKYHELMRKQVAFAKRQRTSFKSFNVQHPI